MRLPGYRLGVRLGQSAHFAVYRAVRERDGVPVIVKTLSRENPLSAEVRRLEFEYRLLDQLRGPRVIEALGLTRTGGQLALVLEDFGGRSLAELSLPLELDAFFRVAREAALGLGHIHGLGVIHEDIAPHNLLVQGDLSRLALINFQTASELSRETVVVNVAHPLEGSLPYIAPEQTGRMNRALDHRTDYYSLGVTFFQLLAAELPFSADDELGWVHCHVSATPAMLHDRAPSVPVMLSRIVAKLMAKEPRDRYQSSHGLLADLSECEALVRTGRGAEQFALGRHDVSARFAVSQELFGRDGEIGRLTAALEEVVRGPGKLLVVSGDSGVGKSRLIRELDKALASHRGYFAAGKLEPLERGVPHGGLIEALRQLVRQWLAQPRAPLEDGKRRLLDHVGAAAGVLTELVPELSALIGPQAAPPPLEPSAARNRLQLALSRLIEALATAEHPLLIFLDDAQWADACVADLVTELFIAWEAKHVLIALAYREDEGAGRRPLERALRRLREAAPQRLVELSLHPLSERAIEQWAASTLQRPPSECAPLAHAIQERTGGDPLFAGELFWTWYRRGAISFSADAGHWSYDLALARSLATSSNVIELLLERLAELPGEARLALQTAACIDSPFLLSTLASLLECSPDAAASSLRSALRDGLILPLDDSYKLMQPDTADRSPHAAPEVRYVFRHDRVQRAAYSSIPGADRAAKHLSIGRRLLAAERDPEHLQDVFSVTRHLNLGRTSMSDASERELLAKLNRKAGAKALAASAFALAAHYHDAGAAALTEKEWSERPELHFALFSERVGSLLMAGERERAAVLCEELFALAPTTAARAAVSLMKSQLAMHAGRLEAAVEAARQGLGLLGVEYPDAHAEIDSAVAAGIEKMQAHLARVPIEELAGLPECTDAEKIVAQRLLCHVAPAAAQLYPPLFVLTELTAFDLMLRHGTTGISARTLAHIAQVQCGTVMDHATGYRLGQAAFRLLERYEARALHGPVHFAFAAWVSHWSAPHAESLHSFEEARRASLEGGAPQDLAAAEALHLRLLLALGRHLSGCAAVARAAAAVLERTGASAPLATVRSCQLAIEQLDDSDGASARGADAERRSRDGADAKDPPSALLHGQLEMLVHVLLGDWDAAVRWSDFTRPHVNALPGTFVLPEYCLLECLIGTQCRWPRSAEGERSRLVSELQGHVEQLRRWSDACPENFAHKYLLAAAEMARIRGESAGVVVALYDQAIETTEHQFLHLRALGSELFGHFLLGLGRGRLAEPLLRDALALYERWGSGAKVRRLRAELERSFPRSGQRVSSLPPGVGAAREFGVREGAHDLTSALKGLERTVADRTRELAAERRKMAAVLDAIEQAVFTLDRELRVQPEYSRHLERWLGQKDLVGRRVIDVLFEGSDVDPARREAHEAALRLSFLRTPASDARPSGAQLIETYSRPGSDGSRRQYELGHGWLAGDSGNVDGVLVTVRDVTELRRLERAAATAAREAELLSQIIEAGLEDFKSFCDMARRSLDDHRGAAARGSFDSEQRRALLFDLQAIEGHARALGLERIAAAAQAAMGTWSPASAPAATSAAGSAALEDLAAAIQEYERTGQRKLGRLWSVAGARFQQALGAIESALAQTPERPSYPVRALTQVKQVVHRLNAIPLDQVLRDSSRVFPSLARELGKSVPELQWVDDGTLLHAEWGRVMKDALVHTFRNSLDHGIETREERAALGKAPRGKIALFTERDDHGVRIHLRDDGRGLPITELRHEIGRPDGPDPAGAEAIFDYGLSATSQLSHVSGLGIGMDGVRGVLRERGGDVAIAFTGDARAGYRPFEIVFCLPNDAVIAP